MINSIVPSTIKTKDTAFKTIPAVLIPDFFLLAIPNIKPTIDVIKPTQGTTKLTIPNTNEAVALPSVLVLLL